MDSTERTELLKAAIRVYGEPAQIDMAVEEMSELTKALCKAKRARGVPEAAAAISNVIEEISDVQIMLDQLRIIFGSDTAGKEQEKLERLDGRLKKATAGRSCENCGNVYCANSLVAFWWDECVASKFTKHWTPKKNAAAEWWLRSTAPGLPIMESRLWHREAKKRGAELRVKMQPDKVYLYQLFTTSFVEFPNMDAANAFKEDMSANLPEWNVDPVIIIDTSDPEQVKSWAANMEKGDESHG